MAGGPIGDALRQVHRLLAGGTVAGQGDAALLGRFVAERDEDAFAALVARHGPMVLAVCRATLRDPRDAEDAFQAVFLVLVRRAGAVRVDDSLGGWLYRVARRVALRANRDALRRRAREHQGMPMDAIADRGTAGSDRPEAELHAEIARLPESYRRAIVLCELEGRTQAEAARELRCGEATLRRRLAGARERLRARLGRRGLAGSVAPALAVPSGWIEATARAAVAGAVGTSAAKLAGAVAAAMARARRIRVGLMALVGGVGIATAWAVGAAQQGKGEGPKAVPAATAKPEAPAPTPGWAHLTDDIRGFEEWVRLADGFALWKWIDVNDGLLHAGLRDPAANAESRYDGEGAILRQEHAIWPEGTAPLDVDWLLTRGGVGPQAAGEMSSRRATDEERHFERGNVYFDREFETLDGRRTLRVDTYTQDTLGRGRMSRQTWFDVETRRPVSRRELLQLGEQVQFKREYKTTRIEYVATGPADLVALGVPAGTPVLDAATARKVVIPPDLRRALDGAATSLERLPRDCRIVVDDEEDGFTLTYWSCPADYLAARVALVRDQDDDRIYRAGRPRSFVADHQPTRNIGLPDDVPPDLRTDPATDLPADRIAAWFPFGQSVNIALRDGTRQFHLARLVAERGKPRRVQVHVHKDGFPDLPKPIEATWPFASDNRQKLAVVPPDPGTPAGWVALRVDYGEIRRLYHADPARGHAVAREVEWTTMPGPEGSTLTFRTESKALRWAQLPGGTWYASAWERHHHLDRLDALGKVATPQPDRTSHRRVAITPMDPSRFPPGIFDGENLLDAARKEGAEVRVD